jgi:predicted nucleotide-binding protein (sugar kinase/HSP70/actin superfamily)
VAWHAKHGADGVIDISPFACMNGTVSEAIYPKVSRDYGGIPVRSFYFDGTRSELDRDLGVYLELARSYNEKKTFPRAYAACFNGEGRRENTRDAAASNETPFGSPGNTFHTPPKQATQE